MQYMTCPRCGLSVRLRASYLTLDRCPRCIAKRGVSIPMVISDERRTSGAHTDLGAVGNPRFDLMPGELRIETTWDGEALTLALRGELDLASARTLKRHLEEAQAGGVRRVVVDLCELEFLDSAGLHVLLDAHQRLRAHQRTGLFLRRGRRSIQRLFELTSTDSVFQFETDRRDRAPAQRCR